jgi:hypothetical protein
MDGQIHQKTTLQRKVGSSCEHKQESQTFCVHKLVTDQILVFHLSVLISNESVFTPVFNILINLMHVCVTYHGWQKPVTLIIFVQFLPPQLGLC